MLTITIFSANINYIGLGMTMQRELFTFIFYGFYQNITSKKYPFMQIVQTLGWTLVEPVLQSILSLTPIFSGANFSDKILRGTPSSPSPHTHFLSCARACDEGEGGNRCQNKGCPSPTGQFRHHFVTCSFCASRFMLIFLVKDLEPRAQKLSITSSCVYC